MSAVDLRAFRFAPPTLRELADKAVQAARTINDPNLPDAHWNRARASQIDANEAFQQQFYEATGLTPSLVRQLCDEGLFL